MNENQEAWVKVYEHKRNHWLYSVLSIGCFVLLSVVNHRIGGGSLVVDGALLVLTFIGISSLLSWAISRNTYVGDRHGAIRWLQGES